ncbi:MAG: hypothetical protein M3300_09125 [Actinomycetota bacterium]|jgi:hypothetical protein|nr:hypothetical protein [Actinomycetota bacterium]
MPYAVIRRLTRPVGMGRVRQEITSGSYRTEQRFWACGQVVEAAGSPRSRNIGLNSVAIKLAAGPCLAHGRTP